MKTEWQPIETAPKDCTRILIVWCGGGVAEARWHNGSDNYWKLAGFYFMDDNLLTDKPHNPTHWMPMPFPPIPTAKEGE